MPEFKFETDWQIPAPADNDNALGDLRFRNLLSRGAWLGLPKNVRDRFSKRVKTGDSVVYKGYTQHTKLSRMGFILAHTLRILGAPLPYESDNIDKAAVVTVTEDTHDNGQFWTRQYSRARGFPHVIHSSKRFAGPTGLEEHIGCGIGMTLKLAVNEGSLLFKSHRYFCQVIGHRIYLPNWLTPGELTVGHHDHGDGWFEFTLNLTHRLFGQLVDQSVMFEDYQS